MMELHSLRQQKDLYVVSVIGGDRVGLVSKVTQFLFSKGFNIVDIEQTVIHSQFTMVLLIQPARPRFHLGQVKKGLNDLAKKMDMSMLEVPITFKYRVMGKSKFKFLKTGKDYFKLLIKSI